MSCFRNLLIKLTKHKAFDIFIMTSIVGNTLVLAMKWHGMPKDLEYVFESINYVFMIVFALEAVVKIIAMRCMYFKDAWNLFDFSVVVLTSVAMSTRYLPINNNNFEVQATFIRILRILRVLRTIKRVEKL